MEESKPRRRAWSALGLGAALLGFGGDAAPPERTASSAAPPPARPSPIPHVQESEPPAMIARPKEAAQPEGLSRPARIGPPMKLASLGRRRASRRGRRDVDEEDEDRPSARGSRRPRAPRRPAPGSGLRPTVPIRPRPAPAAGAPMPSSFPIAPAPVEEMHDAPRSRHRSGHRPHRGGLRSRGDEPKNVFPDLEQFLKGEEDPAGRRRKPGSRGRGGSPKDREEQQPRPRSERSRAAERSSAKAGRRKAFFERKPLRPPQSPLERPPVAELHRAIPARLPDGTSVKDVRTNAESLRPPEPKRLLLSPDDDSNPAEHWHSDGVRRFLHRGAIWGVWDGAWHWTVLDRGRWWTLSLEDRPLVWHQEHWWWQADGVWFVQRGDEAWAYRWFSRWKSEGLIEPKTGVQLIYSQDERYVAVATPGDGATIYEASTGREVRRREESAPGELFDVEPSHGRAGGRSSH
ncbi:MAG: hypothetical protein HY078_13200 [Elusimicrobia bacterium]|nr:hypothetical protein [Elusimicrobiota bacterium]